MQNADTHTKLTEFAPLESESRQSGSLFSRLFKRTTTSNNGGEAVTQNKELKARNFTQNEEKKTSSSAPASAYSSPSHASAHEHQRQGSGSSLTVPKSQSNDQDGDDNDDEEERSEEAKAMSEEQRRTLSGVLRRLGNILERRGQTPQAYKDSDFKQYWMPDSNCKQCYECGDRFTTFRRRHHCRICGQIFCSRCCNQEVPGKIMGYTGCLRVCTYCCQVVLKFANNFNTSGNIRSDLKENVQKTRTRLENHPHASTNQGSHDQPWVSPSGRKRSKPSRVPSFYGEDLKLRSVSEVDLSAAAHNPFDITPQSDYANPQTILEERKALLKDSVQLRELWVLLQDPYNGIELQSHRHRLRTYPNCLIGSELVDWLVAKDKANSRDQAIVIGQALLDARYLELITVQQQVFSDSYTLYKPGETATTDVDLEVTTPQDSSFFEDESEPQWFREISGESDSDSDVSSDLNKIPSTLSAAQMRARELGNVPKSQSQSVFYLDPNRAEAGELQAGAGRGMRGRMRHSSGATLSTSSYESGSKDSSPISCLTPNAPRKSMDISSSRAGNVLTENVVSLEHQLGWQSLDNLREENGERLAYQRICKIQWEHACSLTRQLLSKEGLSLKWTDIIMAVTRKISQQVRPDVRHEHDDMDIRQYVQVKKGGFKMFPMAALYLPEIDETFTIPGGTRNKTEIVSGVVCTKNIQHKKMRSSIQSPRILLLRAAIEYQRVENKFNSLEPQILQEHEYLKNCVARIAALKPDILLVERTVSRVAQEFIFDTGITLVSNVKPSVMERVSRFTQADIVTSIDGLVSKTTLGFCHTFKVHSYKLPDGRSKTLMYFDGCAHHLGCTVTLRGALTPELQKVKQILQFVTYVSYHLKLELSYLMDSFAMPPALPDENILGDSFTDAITTTDPDARSLGAKSSVTDEGDSGLSVKNGALSSSARDNNSKVPDTPIMNPLYAAKLKEEQKAGKSPESTSKSTAEVPTLTLQIPEVVIVLPDIVTSAESAASNTGAQQQPSAAVDVLGSKTQQQTKQQQQYSENHQLFMSIEQSSKLQKQRSLAEQTLNTSKQQPVPKPSSLEVKDSDPFMRGRSNSTNLRPFSDIKRHKRSISDYSPEKLSSSSLTITPQFQQQSSTSTFISALSGNSSRTSTEISDFSDPLHEYQRSKDESIFQQDNIKLQDETKIGQDFKKALTDVIISTSPLLKYEVPHLETVAGAKCELRKYFPRELYWSRHLTKGGERKLKSQSSIAQSEAKIENLSMNSKVNEEMTQSHEFLQKKLTVPVDDHSVQVLVADFRARGGRLIQKHLAAQQSSQTSAAEKINGEEDQQNSELWENRVDCLALSNHQKVAVLFSSFSAEVNGYCVNPWVVTMDHYGRNDITLGGFLDRYCFKEAYSCPSEICDSPIVDHTRRFVHESGCLTVMLKKLETPFPNFQNNVLMWAWCTKCKKLTPVVPMSLDTWSMSFSKYLELHFYAHQYGCRAADTECTHNLHHDYDQCFGYKQIIASFKFSSVALREITLPPVVLKIRPLQLNLKSVQDEAKMLNYKGTSVFNAIIESLLKLQDDTQYINNISELDDKERQLQNEQAVYRKMIECLSTRLEDLSLETCSVVQQSLVFVINDLLANIKRQVAKAVVLWNERFQDLDVQSKKMNKALASQAKMSKASTVEGSLEESPASQPRIPKINTVEGSLEDTSLSSLHGKDNLVPVLPSSSSSSASLGSSKASPAAAQQSPAASRAATKTAPATASANAGAKTATESNKVDEAGSNENEGSVTPPVFSLGDDDLAEKQLCVKCKRYSNRGVSKIIILEKCGHDICRICYFENDAQCPVCPKPVKARRGPMSLVGRLADADPGHFGSPSPGSDHWSSLTPPGASLGQQHATPPHLHSIDSVTTDEESGQSDTPSTPLLKHVATEPTYMPHIRPEQVNDAGKPPSKDKPAAASGMKNIISSLLYNSGSVQIQMPFTTEEHHLLPPCDRIPVVVFDEEPSSIIAYTLSSSDYQYQLEDLTALITNEANKSQNQRRQSQKISSDHVSSLDMFSDSTNVDPAKKNASKVLSFFKGTDNNSVTEPVSKKSTTLSSVDVTNGGVKLDSQSVKYTPRPDRDSVEDTDEPDFGMFSASDGSQKAKQKEPEISYHIELQFSDSSAKFYCRVYYAEQFRKLRKLILPEGEDRFIRSLSRCYTWLATGGKSGSAFCKTQDDRFILKQMSRYEVQSFVEFAPHYFKYTTKAYNEKRPTALAKIFGVYRIGFRNSQNNMSLKQDVLVMENLFYDRKITQIFDLKGSVRNRLVNTSGKQVQELVLLDENLLKSSLESPLYIRPHSKTVLTLAITNDTQFLSSHLVMDYSLLVGIDDNTKELVVGIIDYIRTFTWDKKIEMVVKSTYSHIGGQGKMPTVVSPELYRSRFLEAMDRYFLHVPDRWTGLGQNVDC